MKRSDITPGHCSRCFAYIQPKFGRERIPEWFCYHCGISVHLCSNEYCFNLVEIFYRDCVECNDCYCHNTSLFGVPTASLDIISMDRS